MLNIIEATQYNIHIPVIIDKQIIKIALNS